MKEDFRTKLQKKHAIILIYGERNLVGSLLILIKTKDDTVMVWMIGKLGGLRVRQYCTNRCQYILRYCLPKTDGQPYDV